MKGKEPRAFDEHATAYNETIDEELGASGESVEFFAQLKADLTRRAWVGPTPQRILDFGCGIGNGTRALSAAFPTASVVGIDSSGESVRIAASRASEQTRFAQQDGAALPFGDGSFDLVFASCVFHHIERPDHHRAARQLRRVLRPGGAIFLFEHNPYNPLTVRVVRSLKMDEGVTLLPPGYSRDMLRAAGFEVSLANFYFFFPKVLRFARPLETYMRRIPMGAQYFVSGRRV